MMLRSAGTWWLLAGALLGFVASMLWIQLPRPPLDPPATQAAASTAAPAVNRTAALRTHLLGAAVFWSEEAAALRAGGGLDAAELAARMDALAENVQPLAPGDAQFVALVRYLADAQSLAADASQAGLASARLQDEMAGLGPP